MKLNINAGLVAAVSVFRAKDDIRSYLGGVYVEPLDAGVMIVATQGHAMCMWRDAEGFAERPAILAVSDKLIKACNKNPSACLTVNDGRLSIINSETCAEIYTNPTEKLGDWEIEAKYPDVRRVIPDLGVKQLLEPFNGSLLNLARKALRAANQNKWFSVNISQFSEHGPIAISSVSQPDFFAVLMPMREDGKIEDIPKFAIDFKASKHPEQSK